MGNGPGSVVVIVAIWIALFLIFRAIVLWYWRVNEGIALLKSIDAKLIVSPAVSRRVTSRTFVDPLGFNVWAPAGSISYG